jgi:hypothetical protein
MELPRTICRTVFARLSLLFVWLGVTSSDALRTFVDGHLQPASRTPARFFIVTGFGGRAMFAYLFFRIFLEKIAESHGDAMRHK